MARPFGDKDKDKQAKKGNEEGWNGDKWWADMYQMRFVVTAGIGVFVFLMWNFPDHLKYLPICVGIMLLAWWVATKA